MKQQTLSMAADCNEQYEKYRKPTRRDAFLAAMEGLVPWAALCGVIEPHYPKAGNGRPPIGLERMLRMYFVQHWFNLADAACEDALLDALLERARTGYLPPFSLAVRMPRCMPRWAKPGWPWPRWNVPTPAATRSSFS